MADTTATPPSPIWSFLLSLTPSLGQCLVLLVTCAVGVAGTLATQRVNALRAPSTLPVAAPDLPKPTPIACAQAAHDIDTKLNDILACLRGKKCK